MDLFFWLPYKIKYDFVIKLRYLSFLKKKKKNKIFINLKIIGE